MIKNSCLLIMVISCMHVHIFSSDNGQKSIALMQHSTSFTDLQAQALSRSHSITSLPDEHQSIQYSTDTSTLKTPYSELHYIAMRLAGKGQSNTTYLLARDQDGSLLPTLQKEPVRAQNLFNSAFYDRFNQTNKPMIEDEENQERLAAIIRIGKKYSKRLCEYTAISADYDSDDSDDLTPFYRSDSQLISHISTAMTKLELASNLAETCLPLQQKALLQKLTYQKKINQELLATKKMLLDQALEQETQTQTAAILLEQQTLEKIDAERKEYMKKWEIETAQALAVKDDAFSLAAQLKAHSFQSANDYYDIQIAAMKGSAATVAANLRYIKTKTDQEITIPYNAHKKRNYTTSQTYLEILDRIQN